MKVGEKPRVEEVALYLSAPMVSETSIPMNWLEGVAFGASACV